MDAITTQVLDAGRKRSSGEILILDPLSLKLAIEQGFKDFVEDAKEMSKLTGVKP